MHVTYHGTETRQLAFPGGTIAFEPGQTIDLAVALEAIHVPAHHIEIAVRGLEGQDLWSVGEPLIDRPADSAGKAKWVAYARQNGWAAAAAKKATRDELAAAFPAPTQPAATAPADEDTEEQLS